MSNNFDGNLAVIEYDFCKKVFLWNRSILGSGIRATMDELERASGQKFRKIKFNSGTTIGDWIVPHEWIIRDAYIADKVGTKVVDFEDSNLHVIGYSQPINTVLSKAELEQNIYTDPTLPNELPYVTSYYKERWGFCLSHNQWNMLPDSDYKVFIDSSFVPGHLELRELLIKGKDSTREILVSTYCCHPSMANNELSGPAVFLGLVRYFSTNIPDVSIRFVIGPETIGAIAFLEERYELLRARNIGGFILSCIGDSRAFSVVKNLRSHSYSFDAVKRVSQTLNINLKEYSFIDRGSDERQYAIGNTNLDIICLCRSRFGSFPEYHSSADSLALITPQSLSDSITWVRQSIEQLSRTTTLIPPDFKGEPFFEKHISSIKSYQKSPPRQSMLLRHVFAFLQKGTTIDSLLEQLLELSDFTKPEILEAVNNLKSRNLLFEEKLRPTAYL